MLVIAAGNEQKNIFFLSHYEISIFFDPFDRFALYDFYP